MPYIKNIMKGVCYIKLVANKMDIKQQRNTFTGKLGFVMTAAGSAVGLGNIWRFPYLAVKDNGGVFILCYIILAVTFGFTLLTTEISIGRKTHQSSLTAYAEINSKWGFLGTLASLVPVIILPYYCAIGGWVIKYFTLYLTDHKQDAIQDNFFSNFIAERYSPIIFAIIFLTLASFIVFSGVNKGIEKYSKILMPILFVLIIGIAIYSLTLSHTNQDGITKTGLDGLKVYLIPNFTNMTIKDFFIILMDAMGQLFFSISVAMGIMVTYGSYVKKDVNLMQSINQIEIFDTIVALLAGLMIVPAVYIFSDDGMSAGPGLMFISLPKVFNSMGSIGNFIGLMFFLMVLFAAITSVVSVMETIVSSIIDKFKISRKKSALIVTIYALIGGAIVCMGYNILYFEVNLPNGTTGQILDILDYISNNCLMPLVAILTCILIGWIVKPKIIIDEVTQGGYKFTRKNLYIIMIKYIAPILLVVLLMQSIGIISL